MKLSTRARYGIHAMFELAARYGQGPQPLKSIAESQNIPEQYLEQLIALLRREGLVESVRGAQGGYMLGKAPGDITMGELMHVLEGPILLADCLADDKNCERSCACPTKGVWERLSKSMDDVLNSVTLQDMLDDHKRMMAESAHKEENP